MSARVCVWNEKEHCKESIKNQIDDVEWEHESVEVSGKTVEDCKNSFVRTCYMCTLYV